MSTATPLKLREPRRLEPEPAPAPARVAVTVPVAFVSPQNYGGGIAWTGQLQVTATAPAPTRVRAVPVHERLRSLLHADVLLPLAAAVMVLIVLLAWAP